MNLQQRIALLNFDILKLTDYVCSPPEPIGIKFWRNGELTIIPKTLEEIADWKEDIPAIWLEP